MRIQKFDPPISNGGSKETNAMFDYDAVARTHFTKKSDGRNSWNTWVQAMGLMKLELKFEFPSGLQRNGKDCMFVAESWGGYDAGHGVWIVFCSWRCAAINANKYVRWDWDAQQNKCHNMRWNEWVN